MAVAAANGRQERRWRCGGGAPATSIAATARRQPRRRQNGGGDGTAATSTTAAPASPAMAFRRVVREAPLVEGPCWHISGVLHGFQGPVPARTHANPVKVAFRWHQTGLCINRPCTTPRKCQPALPRASRKPRALRPVTIPGQVRPFDPEDIGQPTARIDLGRPIAGLLVEKPLHLLRRHALLRRFRLFHTARAFHTSPSLFVTRQSARFTPACLGTCTQTPRHPAA